MSSCLMIKLLASENYLIEINKIVEVTDLLSELRRYGVFADFIEVSNIIEKFDKKMELGKDYTLISLPITDEVKKVLDIKLLLKILPVLLLFMNGNMTQKEFNIEIRKIKRNWSWQNCFKWMTGLGVRRALDLMTEEELRQVNATRIEILALMSAINDWDTGNV